MKNLLLPVTVLILYSTQSQWRWFGMRLKTNSISSWMQRWGEESKTCLVILFHVCSFIVWLQWESAVYTVMKIKAACPSFWLVVAAGGCTWLRCSLLKDIYTDINRAVYVFTPLWIRESPNINVTLCTQWLFLESFRRNSANRPDIHIHDTWTCDHSWAKSWLGIVVSV